MDPWKCSLLYYILIFNFCYFSKILLKSIYRKEKYYIKILYELIGTIQTCTPSFDVFFVLTHYGVFGFFLEILLLELFNNYFPKEAYADPSPLLIELFKNKNKKWFSILLLAQLVGGIISFQIARFWWSLNIHPTYFKMFMNTNCHSHLNISIINGMLIEGLGVIGIHYIIKLINKYVKNDILINFLSAISIASICVCGLDLTGMYANPIIAWSCTFNCQGLSHLGHFIVYWIGPTLGSIIVNEIRKENIGKKDINKKKKNIFERKNKKFKTKKQFEKQD